VDSIRLLPEPPDGFVEFKPSDVNNLWQSIYGNILSGYTSGIWAVWIATSSESPVKVVRLAAWLYERPEFAKRNCVARSPSESHLSELEETLQFERGIDDFKALIWRRGTVQFTSLDRPCERAIISCEAAGDVGFDALPLVRDLHRQVETRLPTAGFSLPFRPIVRQMILGALIGLICALILKPELTNAVGNMLGNIIILLVGAALVYAFYFRPRKARLANLRRFFAQGDPRGDIKRALLTLGVQLPPSTGGTG
jgi:hypothetical protein